MNLEKLKLFLDLYECGSYTETARRNFVSQATVSQYVASLEQEFNTTLFNRKVKPILPTDSGRKFFEEANILWKQYENMQDQMKTYTDESSYLLRLAYTSLDDLVLLLPILNYIKESAAKLKIEIEKVPCKDISSYISNGVYDIGMSFSVEFVEEPELMHLILKTGNYHALVGKMHPLFNNQAINLDELYKYPLLMLSEEMMGAHSYKVMNERSVEDGYLPKFGRAIREFEESFFYIFAEDLIGFVTEEYNNQGYEEYLAVIPINESKHSYKIVLAYKNQNGSPALMYFLELYNKYLLENLIVD